MAHGEKKSLQGFISAINFARNFKAWKQEIAVQALTKSACMVPIDDVSVSIFS